MKFKYRHGQLHLKEGDFVLCTATFIDEMVGKCFQVIGKQQNYNVVKYDLDCDVCEGELYLQGGWELHDDCFEKVGYRLA